MRLVANHIAFHVIVMTSSAMLVACSSVFIIKPMGRLSDAVSFSFYEAASGVTHKKVKLTEFIVQEKSEVLDWKTVWELNGSQAVEMITYGMQVDGLTQTMAAKPLNTRSKYRVIAREKPLVGPPGYSTVHFGFDTLGQVVETNP